MCSSAFTQSVQYFQTSKNVFNVNAKLKAQAFITTQRRNEEKKNKIKKTQDLCDQRIAPIQLWKSSEQNIAHKNL